MDKFIREFEVEERLEKELWEAKEMAMATVATASEVPHQQETSDVVWKFFFFFEDFYIS